MLGSDYWAIVLWIDAGIVAIPLFKIVVPLSSECVSFGSEFSRTEMDYKVESRRYLDQCACQCMGILVIEMYCKFQ